MKVWITKYALTKGIFEMEAEEGLSSGEKYASGKHNGYPVFTSEFAKTRAAALVRAEEMRVARIASLKKQIAKLEKKVFKRKTEKGLIEPEKIATGPDGHFEVSPRRAPVCQYCGRSVGFGHTTCGPCSDVP